jgi:hypothetical protein
MSGQKEERAVSENLTAEKVLEILLNSSIPDALYTIEFGGRLTKKVESTKDRAGVRRGLRVVSRAGTFVLWVQMRRKPGTVEKTESPVKKALREFVDAINATGGVTTDRKGYTVPVADQEWIDLGDAYDKACEALGVKPQADDAAYELPEDLTLDEEGNEVSGG